ncbi:MAG: hypothetical protein NPMRTH1_920006 [Nitrosopumilales archaeon]|nr:MAG: hypothetical protein NPMRTH1_920006 [Nitrosopumilales archaeon]
MGLTTREKVISLVSNAVAVYSVKQEEGSLPENVTLFEFILKAMPDELKPELSMEVIDEVFEYVSSAHSS